MKHDITNAEVSTAKAARTTSPTPAGAPSPANPSNPTLAELRASMSAPSPWRLPIDGGAEVAGNAQPVTARILDPQPTIAAQRAVALIREHGEPGNSVFAAGDADSYRHGVIESAIRLTSAELLAKVAELRAALEMAIEWSKEVPAPYREFPFIAAARAALA